MKKLFFISISLCLIFLTGCMKYNEKSLVKDLNKKINAITGYHIEGNMEIYNGDNTYKYNVESSYENDQYRVSLINKANDHEQIILKNNDGVYVLTPSLNKSFKFQSNWPNNNSQVYLLESVLNDINKDKEVSMEEKDNKYILKTKISYSNNKNLDYQKIYMDKKLNFEKIEVFDEDDNIQIRMKFTSIDTKATFNNKYFSTAENMKSAQTSENNYSEENDATKEDSTTQYDNATTENETEENTNNNFTTENNTNSSSEDSDNNTSNTISEEDELPESSSSSTTKSLSEDTVYPMYLPEGTYLSTEETVSKEEGERVILTFAGESPFILVEETATKSDEMEIIPVYGEPTLLVDTVGALSESSVNFISNGVEYYIASESLSIQEIINVAESISSIPVMK